MSDPGLPGTDQQTRGSNREAHPARSLCACMGLRPPREHACVVARPELTARVVASALDKRLSLIKAPSGYGKTTLLAEVFRSLDATDAPHIWFSGSYADRDATWIDATLAEQLARHCQLDITSDKTFVTLAHEVQSKRPLIVVLDNWDFVETIETNRYFDRLLQLTDGIANFVVSSRSVPGFAFEIYRIGGEFAEYGVEDLRLDDGKIREVLGKSVPSLGSGTQATSLLARTEGWPAGVQLLRLALEQASPATKLDFSGSREDVSNYLQETLFSKFDPKTQAFLCHVAHLDELSPDLIRAILPCENAAKTFAQVRRENVLLNEIHEGSANYRFHTLFRDFLLARAEHYSRWSEAEICARACSLSGLSRVVVAGGMESMSSAPYLLPKERAGARLGHGKVIDSMFFDGLEDHYFDCGRLMGSFGDAVAKTYGFSCQDQDSYAIETLKRAQGAQKNGSFADEIAPVQVPGKTPITVRDDEQPSKSNPDKIASLRPAFNAEGTITAANASSISDGAAALVLADSAYAAEKGLKPIARILGVAGHAGEPADFPKAPVPAMRKLLDRLGWTVDDVDLFDVNEAFAMVAMIAMKDLGIPHTKLNVNDGACALGHPIGASGARITVTLLSALRNRGLKRGMAGICIGGGEATAIAVELL